MESKRPSVFMQMHNGTRRCEGSFNVGLQKLFYLADPTNQRKLVEAFPEFFGEEVPEFGIIKKAEPDKTFRYKGWLCEWDGITRECSAYTPDEMDIPKSHRQAEYECSTREKCKQFIDSY